MKKLSQSSQVNQQLASGSSLLLAEPDQDSSNSQNIFSAHRTFFSRNYIERMDNYKQVTYIGNFKRLFKNKDTNLS